MIEANKSFLEFAKIVNDVGIWLAIGVLGGKRDHQHSQDIIFSRKLEFSIECCVYEPHLKGEFIIDSGSTHHTTGSRENLSEYKDFEKNTVSFRI